MPFCALSVAKGMVIIMMHIAIVDDDFSCIDDIKEKISSVITIEYNLRTYQNEVSFLYDLRSGLHIDLVFLDIKLQERNGIEVAAYINKISRNTSIIFVSANPEYYQDVYEAEHICFLGKPVDLIRLRKAINRVIDIQQNCYLVLNIRTTVKKVLFNRILYFESELKSTKIFYSDGTFEKFAISLMEIEPLLPKNIFMRTHKSFIVNLDYLTQAERLEITLSKDFKVPVSKAYAKGVKDKITLYLGGC